MPATSPYTEDKRHFTRIPMEGVVRIYSSQQEWETHLLDISLKGALLQCPEGYDGQNGDNCRVEVVLDPDWALITMHGKVSHQTHGNIGFSCQHIDLDSISHLKRLVELNLGDESLLERELEELTSEALKPL